MLVTVVWLQNERAEMQQELETLRTQVVKAQAAANAAHEDKQLLQRQLTMSVDTNERLKTDLEAQYVLPAPSPELLTVHAVDTATHEVSERLYWVKEVHLMLNFPIHLPRMYTRDSS